MSSLVLYTRRGCQLCEELAAELEQPLARRGLALLPADVDADPELSRRFGHRVPVLSLDGEILDEGRVDIGELLARLDARA